MLLFFQQVGLEPAPEGHILYREYQQFPCSDKNMLALSLEVEQRAVGGALVNLQGHPWRRVPQLAQQVFAISTLAAEYLGQFHATQLLRGPPERVLQGCVGVEDAQALRIHHEDS